MANAAGEIRAPVSAARLKNAVDAVRTALRAALDIALPRLCAICREPVEGEGLCAACWSKLSFITRPCCERVGVPFVYDPGPGIPSMEAIADPPAYNRARAAVRFDEISRALVHALKYGDRLDLAPMMGRWISRAGRELLDEADALFRCPCIGGAYGRGVSINPPCWPRQYRGKPACRSLPAHSSGSSRPRSRLGCRGPNAPPMSKARFVCPATASPA